MQTEIILGLKLSLKNRVSNEAKKNFKQVFLKYSNNKITKYNNIFTHKYKYIHVYYLYMQI